MNQESNVDVDANVQLLNNAEPIPEVVDARQVLHAKEQTTVSQSSDENKGVWTKIVMFLGAVFTFIFSLPADTKKQIAHWIVDTLTKKNEAKKKQLEEQKNNASK